MTVFYDYEVIPAAG